MKDAQRSFARFFWWSNIFSARGFSHYGIIDFLFTFSAAIKEDILA
jgi:hypothetical protein